MPYTPSVALPWLAPMLETMMIEPLPWPAMRDAARLASQKLLRTLVFMIRS